jgi:hypothetical protein
MIIKWEKNSRVSRLAAEGKISDEDVIARCRTDEFPAETATVRIQRVKDKVPCVIVHIRGKSKPRTLWNGHAYECAMTCRVNVAQGDFRNSFGNCMSSNGELDEDYDWQDVHNIVTRVKEAMEL